MGNDVNVALIEKYIKDNNLTLSAFCAKCGISLKTLKNVMENKNFALISLFKIAKAMKVNLSELFI